MTMFFVVDTETTDPPRHDCRIDSQYRTANRVSIAQVVSGNFNSLLVQTGCDFAAILLVGFPLSVYVGQNPVPQFPLRSPLWHQRQNQPLLSFGVGQHSQPARFGV